MAFLTGTYCVRGHILLVWGLGYMQVDFGAVAEFYFMSRWSAGVFSFQWAEPGGLSQKEALFLCRLLTLHFGALLLPLE